MTLKIKRNPEIDDADIDGDKVMMNIDKGQYYMINEIGSDIWSILENEITIEELLNKLIDKYDIDKETCKTDVIEFLGRLSDEELIEIK